jgi:hypothetical protein
MLKAFAVFLHIHIIKHNLASSAAVLSKQISTLPVRPCLADATATASVHAESYGTLSCLNYRAMNYA